MPKRPPLSITTGSDDTSSNATILVETMSVLGEPTEVVLSPGSAIATSLGSSLTSPPSTSLHECPSAKPDYTGYNVRNPQQHTSYGIVKWFDPKGFGFISLLPGMDTLR